MQSYDSTYRGGTSGGNKMAIFNFYEDAQLMFRHLTDEHPNNDPFYMHIHDQYEILYFVGGVASFTAETTKTPLIPGMLMLLRPMESHCITILEPQPYERFTINFSEDLLNAIDPDRTLLSPFHDRALGERNVYRDSEFTIPPVKLLDAMQTQNSPQGSRLAVMTYFYALLGEIKKAFDNKKTDVTTPAAKSLAVAAADYINAHLFENLSVQTIASYLFVSVSQLNRQFKKTTGFSPWDYIIGKRLAAARNLIRNGVPSTHAFADCGFNDYSSFYRLYLKRFGISPKADQSVAPPPEQPSKRQVVKIR